MYGTLLSIVGYLLLCFTLCAEKPTPIKKFLSAEVREGSRLTLSSTGDLNHDALEDWVGIIERAKPGNTPTLQLYVLTQSPRGLYSIAATSKEGTIGGTGCCWVERLTVRDSTIYLQMNAKGGSSTRTVTYRFKMQNGDWQLAGLTVHDLELPSEDSTEVDQDLLTGVVTTITNRAGSEPIKRFTTQKADTYLLSNFEFSYDWVPATVPGSSVLP